MFLEVFEEQQNPSNMGLWQFLLLTSSQFLVSTGPNQPKQKKHKNILKLPIVEVRSPQIFSSNFVSNVPRVIDHLGIWQVKFFHYSQELFLSAFSCLLPCVCVCFFSWNWFGRRYFYETKLSTKNVDGQFVLVFAVLCLKSSFTKNTMTGREEISSYKSQSFLLHCD